MRKTKPSGWVMTLPVGADESIGMKWQHTPDVDPDSFKYDQGEFRRNEQILMHIDYMQDPAYFNIRGNEESLEQLPTRTDSPGSYYYDDVARRVTFSLSKQNKNNNDRETVEGGFSAHACPKTGCPIVTPCEASRTVSRSTTWYKWSSETFWTDVA